MNALELGKGELTLADLRQVALEGRKVKLAAGAVGRIRTAHDYLKRRISAGEALYGVNTGFGMLSNVRIANEDIETLQYNLLRSHAVGMGAPIPDACVRAMLLLRASTLAAGHSGVAQPTVEAILDLLNKGVHPVVPEQGSVGASGDLAPLAHLALVLIGEGHARYRGKVMTGGEALRAARLRPVRLGPKEGLALINGTQFMTAIGALALLEAEHLSDVADVSGALTIEAMRGTVAAFDPLIQEVRPHPGQKHVADRMRILLGHGRTQIARSHGDCGKVQDAYSLRCIPQVHGASRDTFRFARGIVEREMNSVTDNPLIFPAQDKILSGGNFHGQYVAIAMDALSIAVAELASISEQRLEKLMNPVLSDLPAFLTQGGGLNSGFMIVQVAAASIVSENKTLCHPASVDTIPTSADKEDHVSMGAWAARKAARVVVNTRRVLAMELLAAAQGIHLLRPLRTSPELEEVYRLIRRGVPPMREDRTFYPDLQYVEELIDSYELDAVVSLRGPRLVRKAKVK